MSENFHENIIISKCRSEDKADGSIANKPYQNEALEICEDVWRVIWDFMLFTLEDSSACWLQEDARLNDKGCW